jgi:hypothetical protein
VNLLQCVSEVSCPHINIRKKGDSLNLILPALCPRPPKLQKPPPTPSGIIPSINPKHLITPFLFSPPILCCDAIQGGEMRI